MVEHEQSLSQAFMRSHPAAAARVLEALPAAQAAALFERAPARVGAGVLAAMLPSWAARCLAPLDNAKLLELLAQMGTQAAVAVLRHLPATRRQTLASGLPTAVSLASTVLLAYGEDSLGAWADPDIVMLPAETRAAQAIDHLRLATTEHPWVFVADAARRLSGMVSLAGLLQAPPAATLASLAKPAAALLAASESLAGAKDHPAWALSSALPVVAPGDRLLGLMTRDALVRAQRQHLPAASDTDEAEAHKLSTLMAMGYWQLTSGLMAAVVSLLPRAREVCLSEKAPDGH